MPTKLGFASLLILVLICFIPVTLLWGLGVIMLVISIHLESFTGDISSLIPFIITTSLLLMGGVGLVGLIKILHHIYRHGYKHAGTNTNRCLYAGIFSLVILNVVIMFESGPTVSLIIFASPIVAALVLIKLTTKKHTTENPSKIM